MAAASVRSRSGWWLGISFALIAAVFATLEAAGLFWSDTIRDEVGELVESSLVSLELVAAIDHDVAERRWLIVQHVFEHHSRRMEELDARIARIARHIDALTDAYRPLAIWPGELEAWRELKRQLADVEGLVAAVLALSRADRDSEAMTKIEQLESGYDRIGAALRTLSVVNHEAAGDSRRQIRRLQRWSSLMQAGLVLSGISFTALVAIFAIRLVNQRERQLRRYSRRLEERNRELDAFAGRVAHDLRSPLQAVAVAGATLARRANAAALGAAVQRSVDRMESIIHDLLALSRLRVSDELCAPATVAAELRDDLAERVARDGATLRVEVVQGNVRCSATLLRQALANLIDNGLTYRRSDCAATVEVLGRVEGSWYELQVRDHGVGISPEETAQLFQPFYRAGRVHQAPGTGLGLTIVKRVAEACGGSVSVRSALGRGSTFVLRFPLVP